MNRSTRPAYKHELLYIPPFVLTDRLETHQQAFVLLLGYRRYLVHVVASHVLCSFESDVQKLFGDHIQADAIQSSPPEPFLILLFRWGLSLTRAFPRDLHFFVPCCLP